MKNILLESTKSKFKVLEHKPANVLKRIQGVLSDFKSNRNGRIYPRELWENVLNSDYVKEMIESHGLVGELDHPEERLEISLQNVSHVINDMWIEGDQVVGTIDILPTPSGKIVSELLDYGTDIGISSRGAGSVGPNNVVDPDYQFVTFDFVARPSCEAARLNMIVEGVQVEIDNNSDDKVKSILEGYKTNLKEEFDETVFKNYYNKPALPAPGEETLYGYDLSEVCDAVESHYGLTNKRDALNYIYNNKLSKSEIDKAMNYETYTDYSGDRPVEKQRHTMSYCNIAALDMCKDALSDQLGADWRTKSLSDIEDIVHSTVFKYNEANVQPEYEDEDFYGDEANAIDIYQYILDNEIPEENKTTKTRYMSESMDEEPKITAYSIAQFEAERLGGKAYKKNSNSLSDRDIAGFDFDFRNTAYRAEISLTKLKGISSIKQMKESEDTEWTTKIEVNGELQYENGLTAKQVGDLIEFAESIKPLPKDFFGEEEPGLSMNYEDRFDDAAHISGNKLEEAAMSDQEVFKTVLGWYKDQIEKGNMTLNQCYELLSDKAKVSLNKMVDQSKIKESMLNTTINKLIKESIELNKKN